jgi:hypothetical protein
MLKFDLDGVLVKFGEQTEDLMSMVGIKVVRSDKFHWETDPPMENREIWDFFKLTYTFHKRLEAHEGAQELLKYVWQMTGSPIHIITARPSNYTTETQLSIERLFDVPFLLAMAHHDESGQGGNGNKHLYLEPDDIFVEDRRRTCFELEKVGIRTILVDRQYNKIENEEDHPLITRVESLDCIIPMLPFLGAK